MNSFFSCRNSLSKVELTFHLDLSLEILFATLSRFKIFRMKLFMRLDVKLLFVFCQFPFRFQEALAKYFSKNTQKLNFLICGLIMPFVKKSLVTTLFFTIGDYPSLASSEQNRKIIRSLIYINSNPCTYQVCGESI